MPKTTKDVYFIHAHSPHNVMLVLVFINCYLYCYPRHDDGSQCIGKLSYLFSRFC